MEGSRVVNKAGMVDQGKIIKELQYWVKTHRLLIHWQWESLKISELCFFELWMALFNNIALLSLLALLCGGREEAEALITEKADDNC